MSRPLLIVDYGGVLADHYQEPAESRLAAIIGTSASQCQQLLSERSEHGRAFREDRITENEFWNRVYELAGKNLSERPPDDVLSTLWAQTYTLNERVAALLRRVRKAAATGVITNIDRARSNYLVDVIGIEKLVDIYLPSFKFGITKGQAGFWEAITPHVRAVVGDGIITYVDDRQEHVASAIACGLVGIHFTDVTCLETELLKRHLI